MCCPRSRERKVPETAILVGRLPMPRTIMYNSFKMKRSKVKVIRPITAETESVSYLPKGKVYELENWYADRAWLSSLPRPWWWWWWWPAITAYKVGLLHTGEGILCRPHPAATQLVRCRSFTGMFRLSSTTTVSQWCMASCIASPCSVSRCRRRQPKCRITVSWSLNSTNKMVSLLYRYVTSIIFHLIQWLRRTHS